MTYSPDTAPPLRRTDWLETHNAAVVPFTVEQYHHAIATRLIPETGSIELIDGMLVRKDRSKKGESIMSIGADHTWSTESVQELNDGVKAFGMHIRSQQPLTLPGMHEPEPDAAFVVGTREDFRGRKPFGPDVTCVVEVADSSLEYDRTTKQRLYNDANIPQYVLINLIDRVIEVFDTPQPGVAKYASAKTIDAGGEVQFYLGDRPPLIIPAARLLP